MAAFTMIDLTDNSYVCTVPCEHKTCKSTQELFSSPCVYCDQTIEAGRLYVFVKKEAIAHATCADEREERNYNLRKLNKSLSKHFFG